MLVPDGTEPHSGWRVRIWLLKAMIVALAALLVGIVVFFAFYGKVVSRAALTEKVLAENEDLKRYYYKVQLLEEKLNQTREIVTRMTRLAGIDIELPGLPDDSTLFSELDDSTPTVMVRPMSVDWSLPAGMPINGFITQEFSSDDPLRYHPGIDIACAVGTPVLATGSGVVEDVRYDTVYGHTVILRHDDSVTTVYGHNDRILVQPGQEVLVGSRIALSGNSGRSTAPHLHYEIRIHDEPIDPLDNPYEEN
jgi:murein DD-endopeptidase MepM/ murein hydrolase activator NlpD